MLLDLLIIINLAFIQELFHLIPYMELLCHGQCMVTGIIWKIIY